MKHTLSVLVENRPGVLTRIAGLFARRGFNINSLAVGETEDPEVSRMTIVVDGEDERIIEQVTKQLNKLVDVIKLNDITQDEFVDRELIMIKVCCDSSNRAEIIQIVDIFRARIVDMGRNTVIIEATGDGGKVSAIETSLKPFGIKELVRTGKVALVRGAKNRHNE